MALNSQFFKICFGRFHDSSPFLTPMLVGLQLQHQNGKMNEEGSVNSLESEPISYLRKE